MLLWVVDDEEHVTQLPLPSNVIRTPAGRSLADMMAAGELAAGFPGELEAQIRALVRRHIDGAVTREWPAMARQQAVLPTITPEDIEALETILSLHPQGEPQTIAQREIISAMS